MNFDSTGHVRSGHARGHLKDLAAQAGFTLIELLVVIAIIGILSAVVLASLSTARQKGKDAKIQEELSSTRAQAEIYYTGNSNSYATVCTTAGTSNGIQTLMNTILADTGDSGTVQGNGTAGAFNAVTCHDEATDEATAWAAEANMSDSKSGAASMWCADSTGFSGRRTGNLNSGQTVCPAS